MSLRSSVLLALAVALPGCAMLGGGPAPIEDRSVATPAARRPAVPPSAPAPPPAAVEVIPAPEAVRDPYAQRAAPLGLPDSYGNTYPEQSGSPGWVDPGTGIAEIPADAPSAADAWEPPASTSVAVVALVSDAEQRAGSGQLDGAAAALERALRIEPQNPRLWYRLAQVRLQQGQPDQAEALAMKSNSLASADVALRARNWGLIAEARTRKGDRAGAEAAAARSAAP